MLEREFQQCFARNAHLIAVRHHLYGRAAACAERCADGRASAASDNSADNGASHGSSADALGALRAAAFARDVVGCRVNRHDVAVDADAGQLQRQLRRA